MTSDQEKLLLNEIEDARNFRAALARKVDRIQTLVENALVQLCALHDRVDEVAEAKTKDVKGKR